MKYLIPVLLLLAVSTASSAEKPNILWLTCEDNNVNWVGCYGNPHAETPNIDKLASEGFQYMHCYANAPVCAPSRSTWITGVHAISMGTHPMRSRYPIPHDLIKYYPDLLKKAGYYVGNARKTDYNIGGRSDQDAWDTNKVDWKKLKQQQPFFMVINNTKSHESKAFGDVNNTTHSPDDVRLAKYHPDIPEIRKNYAHYHDQMKKMDADIGQALADLERNGLAENTIVIHNSDHGGVLPRSKRFLFNSGTHCPLIIRIPEKFAHLRPAKPGSKVERLVSFIDMTKTWLKICGAETPDYLQGKIFLGPDAESRDFHVSFRTRMDERCDNVRTARDQRFLYVRNYMPYAPWGQHLNYLWNMKATLAWEQHHKAGKTNEVTGRFFGAKPMEELYDTQADPDNVNNLIDDHKFKQHAVRLSGLLDRWQREHFDSGLLPESEIVKRAEEHKTTIYHLVRNPELYNLRGLQEAASLALQQRASNLPTLYKNLSDDDSGLRYWAIVGCFNLQPSTKLDLDTIAKRLDDESHHVRIMAAWILYRAGAKEAAQACWNELLANSSYASLKIFNIIDWIGDGVAPYATAMKACDFSHGGYVARMQQYTGVREEVKKPRKKRQPMPKKTGRNKAKNSKTSSAKKDDAANEVANYTNHNIEGWVVRVSDSLMAEDKATTKRAIELLSQQLRTTAKVLPPKALKQVRTVPIWLSPKYGDRRQTGEYHPNLKWLKDNKRHPKLHRSVEFTNTSIFEKEVRRMPMLLVHELAHAYHDQVLSFEHSEIKKAYDQAVESGTYESVRRNNGRTEKAYAITNHKEYFAETSEAFFGVNDFYPFNERELKRHDPVMYEVLAKVWRAE